MMNNFVSNNKVKCSVITSKSIVILRTLGILREAGQAGPVDRSIGSVTIEQIVNHAKRLQI